MALKSKTTDAIAMLHKRYISGNPEAEAALESARLNAHVASMIYKMRENAGLSQAQLAKRVGTTQSVISRLEDADYDGHSLTMLNRIAIALDQKLTIAVTKSGKWRNGNTNRKVVKK